MAEKTFIDSHELYSLAKSLQSKHYLHLGHIDLEIVSFKEVFGEKPKKAEIAALSGISAAWVKELLALHTKKLYCLTVWSDAWNELPPNMRAWHIFRALLRIAPGNDGAVAKPDVNDFSTLLGFLGVGYLKRTDLPDPLADDCALPPPEMDDDDEGSTF